MAISLQGNWPLQIAPYGLRQAKNSQKQAYAAAQA